MKQKVDIKTKKYTAFLTDIASVMEKHKVEKMLVFCTIGDQIRNTVMNSTGKDDEEYNNISDGIDIWLRSRGRQKDPTSSRIEL